MINIKRLKNIKVKKKKNRTRYYGIFRNAKTTAFAKLGPIPTVPKYSSDFDVTRRQVDIDIVAHYIFCIY